MLDYQPWEFTCETCGGHNLTVSRVWKILAGPDSESWQEWGPLEADHLWHFKFKEKLEKESDADGGVERGNFGEYAEDGSSSTPDDYEIYESQDNPGNDSLYVNCASCDREIEFGWARPNRGGGIFPAECSDFAPSKLWPELRYCESWRRKGWLRSGDDQQ